MERNYSIKAFNTFGLDVVAAYFAKISDLKDLELVSKSNVFKEEKRIILGGGSNCLFLDDYYEGLVLSVEIMGFNIVYEDDNVVRVSVAAGENWSDFVDHMIHKGYSGLENLSLIPGKVGAAPMQNIGAYGVELKDIFYSLQAYDLQTGQLVDFNKDECGFGYRTSVFKTSLRDHYLILSVELILFKKPNLRLEYGAIRNELSRLNVEYPSIKDVSEAVIRIRQSKLPDPKILGNVGSFFKNPVVHNLVFDAIKSEYFDVVGYPDGNETTKLAAGWLIEKAGWKGYRLNDAGVHEKQALVLVNYGNATGRDIFKLAMEIQQSVKEIFGVLLEPEVNII